MKYISSEPADAHCFAYITMNGKKMQPEEHQELMLNATYLVRTEDTAVGQQNQRGQCSRTCEAPQPCSIRPCRDASMFISPLFVFSKILGISLRVWAFKGLGLRRCRLGM